MNMYWLFDKNENLIDTSAFWPQNFTGVIKDDSDNKYWLENGKYHRLDGPACEYADGTKYWCVVGKQVTEEQCKLFYSAMKLKGLL